MVKVEIVVNGVKYELEVKANELLINTLREKLGLKSVRYGCGIGECGNCTILVNGEPILACLTLTVEVNGFEVTTVEGLSKEVLTDIQKAFIEEGAIQCGYCTPAYVIMANYILRENPSPEVDFIKESLKGILCRCTGYINIIKAIRKVSLTRRTNMG